MDQSNLASVSHDELGKEGSPSAVTPPRRTSSWRCYSIRWRLPFLISVLIVLVLGTFLWAAYREVKGTLLQAGGVRAQGAAEQLANLLSQSPQQRLAELRRAAATEPVRRCVEHAADDACQAARASLARFISSGQQSVELWNAAGERVLAMATPAIEGVIPAGSPPSAPGISPLRAHGAIIYSEAIVEVQQAAAGEPSAEGQKRLGFLAVRRLTQTSPTPDVLNRLVGSGATVKIGNRTDDVWTDLGKRVPPPAADLTRAGVSQYRGADGQRRIGALAEIRGTPWAVWVEFPQALVLAPAGAFLERLTLIGLAIVALAAILASLLSARITTPLHELTNASEAIAAGEYSRRVGTNRRDEIGRLGAAFNTMAGQVDDVHRELETRVQQRTARLAETGTLLEQRIEELKEAREELERFFSLSLDMLCIADVEGRFKRVNPAWRDTLGWSTADLTAVPYADFVHPDDLAATTREAAKLADGGTTINFENRYRCKDGSYRWLNWKSSSLPDRGLIYAAARDVTEERRSAQRLETSLAELEAANQELEAFSYSVSHDLRAPLRHITGFAAFLERSAETLDDTGRRYLKTIIESASKMGRLIDDLLAFSRMGRANVVKKRVNLGDLVRAAQQEVEAAAPGRAIAWTIRPLPDVDADPAMLRQAIVNLVSNAVKYTATRPRAEIEIGANGHEPGETVMFVRDNGVGFDMQYAHKLFGVFQRLHSSDDFEGTGIGLANVRRIIHRHGGRTWAEGAVDAGATFYFSLPIDEGNNRERHS
jgi:PAS domain S-box-containing protein